MMRFLSRFFVGATFTMVVGGAYAQQTLPPQNPATQAQAAGTKYKNFRVACYIPVSVVQKFADPNALLQAYNTVSAQLKFDKVYIETYRSRVTATDDVIEKVKKFFTDKGVQVAGGIALSDAGGNGQFVTHSFVNKDDRDYVQHVVELTAKHFDEIVLDDFFFNMNKSDEALALKGTKSWAQFRMDLMLDVSQNVILLPARKVNPKVHVVIKFPNWYEHFDGLGYDLDRESKAFDGIYTGTETRDPELTDQHLQPYESFEIFRYFSNVRPTGNGGGWVDTASVRNIDRYAEQLWDTAFAKAPEITLFSLDAMTKPITPGDRLAWQAMHSSFDYDQMVASFKPANGVITPTMARAAGYSLEQVDQLVGLLGKPIGIASYKPYHSTGEDFLHNWLGMVGIPIDLRPDFPVDQATILLTAAAASDPTIVTKIQGQLKAGKTVIVTSGLVTALQSKGWSDIADITTTGDKVLVNNYVGSFGPGLGTALSDPATSTLGAAASAAPKDALYPELHFLTNDSWPIIRGQAASGNGFPILLMNHYSKGTLYVLAIPDNFNDLYAVPQAALNAIRTYLQPEAQVRLEAPAKVALIPYDNNTFVVQSFLDKAVDVTISVQAGFSHMKGALAGLDMPQDTSNANAVNPLPGTQGRLRFKLNLKPHSYQAFSLSK